MFTVSITFVYLYWISAGNGAWTGTYLSDITAYGDTAVNKVNTNLVL